MVVRFFGLALLVGAIGCGGDDDSDNKDGDTPDLPTVEEFFEAYTKRSCDELEACVPGAVCSIVTKDIEARLEACDYDAEAAQQCLDGDWQCYEQGDAKLVIQHATCETACGEEQ